MRLLAIVATISALLYAAALVYEIGSEEGVSFATERDHLVDLLQTTCGVGAEGPPEYEHCLEVGLREVDRLSPAEERVR